MMCDEYDSLVVMWCHTIFIITTYVSYVRAIFLLPVSPGCSCYSSAQICSDVSPSVSAPARLSPSLSLSSPLFLHRSLTHARSSPHAFIGRAPPSLLESFREFFRPPPFFVGDLGKDLGKPGWSASTTALIRTTWGRSRWN